MRNNNERVQELNRGERRLFGKDITNQVKVKEDQLGQAITKSLVTGINVSNVQRNSLRIVRGKNQSMDENLLKKNLPKISNVREAELFKENVNTVNTLINVNSRVNLLNNNNNNINRLIPVNNFCGVKISNVNLNSSSNNNINNNIQAKGVPIVGISLPNFNYKDTVKTNVNFSTVSLNNNSNNNLEDSNIHMQTVGSDSSQDIAIPSQIEIDIVECLPSNPLPHLEYLEEIYFNLLQEELTISVNSEYLNCQEELSEKMRVILIEWIVDVVFKFKLRQDTFFLTVSIIDRYLSKKKVTRNYLQLLGASSLLIACKFEEIYFPEVRDIVYICDKAYTEKEILAFELEILSTLEFEIFPVFPQRYLQVISQFLSLSQFDACFCNLMLELLTFDYKSNRYSPSLIACTSVYVAFKIKKLPSDECNRLLFKFLNSQQGKSLDEFEREIKECAQSICFLLDNICLPCFRKIREKYCKKEFCEVGKFQIFN